MSSRRKTRTADDLTESWRPRPDFVGPSMPPMIAWQRAGEPGYAFGRLAREAAKAALEDADRKRVGEQLAFDFMAGEKYPKKERRGRFSHLTTT